MTLGICQVPEGRQVFGPMSIEDNLRLGAYTRKGNGNSIAADLERMYEIFPILKEKRQLPAGNLVRWSATNAGHGPGIDGSAEASPAGRAVDGSRSAAR